MSNTAPRTSATRPARAAKVPPSPWIIAITTDAAQKFGIPGGCRVAVRKSREGGYRILALRRTVVIGERFFDTYLVYLRDAENDLVFPRSQAEADAHLQRVFRSN